MIKVSKKTGNVNQDQLWKLFTHDFRYECKEYGYICTAKLIHGVPFLFLVDKTSKYADQIRKDIGLQSYAKACSRYADYVIEGRWDLENDIYVFALVKEKYPWQAIEKVAKRMVYDPQEVTEAVVRLLSH